MAAVALVGACGETAVPPGDLVSGDMVVRVRSDGSFDLRVAGRRLLAATAAPITLRHTHPQAPLLWGQFSYDPGLSVEHPMMRLVAARVGGGVVVLDYRGASGAGSLRLVRLADEVTITVEAEAPLPQGDVVPHPGQLTMRFVCEEQSRFLGFGEQYNAVDHRGETFPLWVSEQGVGRDPVKPNAFSGDPWTTYFPVPFFLDPRGFGVLVDTDSRVEVDLCGVDRASFRLNADEPRRMVLRVYTGPTVADVLRAFTARHGRGGAVPRWAVDGIWLSVQGGTDNVRAAVDRALKAGIPLAAVWVQDWVGRRELGAGNFGVRYRWRVDPSLYPDLGGLIDEVHARGVRFLGYFNPFILPDQDMWQEALAGRHVVYRDDGEPYTPLISVFTGSMLDVTRPESVEWFQGYARQALALGMDGWMADFGEWLPYDAVIHAGEAPREHQLYPTRWHQASRDVLDDDKVLLTRSGWLGEGKAAQVVWAGDQEATWDRWDGLPTVVPALISLGLAGVGWVSHDVAGFSGGPSTRELYLRWLELAAFTPIFRTHEGLRRDENWDWDRDADTIAAVSRWARVHAALAEELMALGREHQETGMPILRALALTFPDDPRAVTISDQFTLGDQLLVAPVVEEGATTRSVYLPAGTWYDVWDPARSIDGPTAIDVAAPLGRPPVFSRSPRADLSEIR